MHKFINQCPASYIQQWNNIWNYYKLLITHCPNYYWYINSEHAEVLRVSYLRCWTMKSPVTLWCFDDVILTVQLYTQIHSRQG